MPDVVAIADESKLPPLSPKQALTLMAMITSITDAEAIAKCPYSEAQFYRIKPLLQKYKELHLNRSVEQSLEMLKALSPKAVAELGEEIKHRDVRIRNKASNDVLNQVMPRSPTTAIKVENNQVQFTDDQLKRLLDD